MNLFHFRLIRSRSRSGGRARIALSAPRCPGVSTARARSPSTVTVLQDGTECSAPIVSFQSEFEGHFSFCFMSSLAICAPGCANGWCKRPNECRCKVGFTGANCTECVPYPGCLHGSCVNNQPWTCDCEPGWGGLICSERLNWCEVHQEVIGTGTGINGGLGSTAGPCQNGGTCLSVDADSGHYQCKCLLGYSGRHCEHIIA